MCIIVFEFEKIMNKRLRFVRVIIILNNLSTMSKVSLKI